MKMVEIEWDDSASPSHWQEPNATSKPMKCRTAGYLLRETRTYVVVASTVARDGGTMAPLAIPKGCITKRRRLK